MPWPSLGICSPGRAWSGEALPGIASRRSLFRAVLGQNVHFLGQNVHFLALLAECPSGWEGGTMGRRGGMCPVARAAPSLSDSQSSPCEDQEFPSLSKALSSRGLASSHLLSSKSF